ncbi:MAG: hypothetical protein AAF721_34940, partial [Myxococcota bacterium]
KEHPDIAKRIEAEILEKHGVRSKGEAAEGEDGAPAPEPGPKMVVPAPKAGPKPGSNGRSRRIRN